MKNIHDCQIFEEDVNIDKIYLKKEKSSFLRSIILTSDDAYKYAKQFYRDDIDIYESMFMIMLDRRANTIGFVKLSQGGVGATLVDTRLICKYAVSVLADSIILIHNHPSGNLLPSEQDKKTTSNTKLILEILDIQLKDHIIMTSENYYSFNQENLL